jgi:hypothetical protein
MVVNALASDGQDVRQPVLALREDADHLAERHLVRRMIIGMAILIPIGAAFFASLVGVAVLTTGTAIAGPVAMGAGAGVLAGIFFGTWAGFVASVNEFEDLEHR